MKMSDTMQSLRKDNENYLSIKHVTVRPIGAKIVARACSHHCYSKDVWKRMQLLHSHRELKIGSHREPHAKVPTSIRS